MTGLVALFYAGVLFTEGVGVYMQQRWAELLMVLATAALIPFEVRHVWFQPSAVATLILAVNCFIVWFLYRVLRRKRLEQQATQPREQSAAASDSLGARTPRVNLEAGQRQPGLFHRAGR